MTSTHQAAGHCETAPREPHWDDAALLALLAIYLVGYAILCLQDYFDLARLPYAPHTSDWLYQIYRPLEWLRNLW